MLALTLVADLTGVTDLLPTDTLDFPYHYTFTVQCTSCRETHPNPVTLSRHTQSSVSGSRGEAHFVWRCKNCKREHSATITGPPKAYQQASPPTRQTIIEIDCRGLEFLEFIAEGEWECRSAHEGSKARFQGVDLSEGEWYDYDEKAGEEVSVKDVKWEVRRA